MEVFLEEAQKRKMSEMALTAFRKRLSPQTGWIHLFIENALDARQDSIPLVENFLYVHALFRSKIAVNIQEGKALLERILAFEVSGNFPLYLHDYPSCHDPKLSSYFLAPLRYLLRDFSSVLGDLLVQKLESLAGRILKYLETVSVSPLVEKRVLAYQGIFDSEAWNPESPTEWAEFCLCAQVAGKNPSKVFSVWDQNHFVFIGKVKERFQEGFEPLVTLLDLFMGEAYQAWSARALEENLVHLRASLVQPFREKPLASALKSCSALIEQDKKQSFTLYSGDQSFTSSLVLESKKGAWAIEEKNAGVFSFEYAYDPEVPSEEDSVEFAFYLSTLDDARVFVGGSRATLFQSGDLLEVPFQGVNLSIKITGVDGEWTGHISKGNRSFQRSPHVYAAYDWKIGFRTLRRGLGAKATIELRVG
jgi:hypothetical protein